MPFIHSYQSDIPVVATSRPEQAVNCQLMFKPGKCAIITPSSRLGKHSTFSALPVAPFRPFAGSLSQTHPDQTTLFGHAKLWAYHKLLPRDHLGHDGLDVPAAGRYIKANSKVNNTQTFSLIISMELKPAAERTTMQ